VILLNQVVQILVLTDLDFVTGCFDERFNGCRIGSTLINCDLVGKLVLSDGFLQMSREE
jgi:hypothetical protein